MVHVLSAVRAPARARAGLRVTCATAAFAVAAHGAFAQELSVLWEHDAASQYGWLNYTRILPWRGPHALVFSAGGAHIAYQYAEVGGMARVRSVGGALSGGYRYESERISITLQPGYAIRQTAWMPPLAPREVGGEHGPTALGEAYFNPTPASLISAVASYDGILAYRLARAGIQRRVNGADRDHPTSLWLGLDVTAQGGSDEFARQAGAVASLEFPSGTWLEARAGLGLWAYGDGARETLPYWSLALVREF